MKLATSHHINLSHLSILRLCPFQLNFQPLVPDVETVHRVNRKLRTCDVIITNKAKTLGLICRSVNKNFGTDDRSKGYKNISKILISKLCRQVVDEQVALVGSLLLWSAGVDVQHLISRTTGTNRDCYYALTWYRDTYNKESCDSYVELKLFEIRYIKLNFL